jgi:hypothetical protein
MKLREEKKMKNTIEFEIITDILSEDLYQTRYIIGKIDQVHFVYVWTQSLSDEEVEVTVEMLNAPKAEHGAMIGTAKEIADHIEICVGLHRDDPDEITAEAAVEVVEELLTALTD